MINSGALPIQIADLTFTPSMLSEAEREECEPPNTGRPCLPNFRTAEVFLRVLGCLRFVCLRSQRINLRRVVVWPCGRRGRGAGTAGAGGGGRGGSGCAGVLVNNIACLYPFP